MSVTRLALGALAFLLLVVVIVGTFLGPGLMSMVRYDMDLANHQRIIEAYDLYWRDTGRPPENLHDLVAGQYLPVRSPHYDSPGLFMSALDYRQSVYELVPSQAPQCRAHGYCVRRVSGREQGFRGTYVEASRPIPGECGRGWCKASSASDIRAVPHP